MFYTDSNHLSKTMGIKPEIEYKDPRSGEIGNFVSDTNIKSTFNDVPSTNVETGIKQTIEWLKTSGNKIN